MIDEAGAHEREWNGDVGLCRERVELVPPLPLAAITMTPPATSDDEPAHFS